MEKVEKKYYYSEIFHSIQGEGEYTGVPTAWIRFIALQFTVQWIWTERSKNPDTYELSLKTLMCPLIKRVEDHCVGGGGQGL